MSNENTARRGLYLPKELDEWFVEMSDNTNIKVNALIISALTKFKESKSKSVKKHDADFEKKVRSIIMRYNDEYHIHNMD